MVIGDLLMGGFLGKFFRKQPDYHYFASNIEDLNQSIKKVLDLNVVKYYVGHGGPLDKNRVEKWFDKVTVGTNSTSFAK